jgi:hypothetical protein
MFIVYLLRHSYASCPLVLGEVDPGLAQGLYELEGTTVRLQLSECIWIVPGTLNLLED